MRKHSPRKWLHAVLDLLPLIIIPIFAIYSHRHIIDNYVVEVPQNKVVEMQQNVKNGNFINSTYWSFNDVDLYNHYAFFDGSDGRIDQSCDIDCKVDDYLLIKFNYYTDIGDNNDIVFALYDSSYDETFANDFYIGSVELTSDYWYVQNGNEYDYHFDSFWLEAIDNDQSFITNIQIFNLTDMFGSGNEPLEIESFNAYFPNDYYSVDSNANAFLKNVGTITYNDTDIGSQFVYALYKPINKYFNLSQVGVFGQLYDFLQFNMFNGNAPISIFIVYHVILYEFIMDLIFLIYCVFMFIIDFAEKMLDSFFDMSFGGGKK